ncbi:MAG: phosphatase PAP2 family protein [Candidatus Thorarchaeota archaeon]
MFFDPGVTDLLRDLMPWAGLFFRAITELGSELFFVGFILTGFWVYRKRESMVLAYVLLAAVVSNYLIKLAIANPRPDPTNWYPGVEATNYSTPSGHAQNTSILFGWISLKSKNLWITITSLVLIVLIGISRVYLGVHYLEDILIGWAIGFVLLAVLYRLQQPLTEFFGRFRSEYLYLTLFLIGFLITLITTYLIPLPPGDNFGALGGLTMGLAVAFPLEERYVGFDTEAPKGQRWRLALRAIIGFVLVLGIMIGLSPLLPSANVWLRAVRYFTVVVIGVFIWPAIFKKINL